MDSLPPYQNQERQGNLQQATHDQPLAPLLIPPSPTSLIRPLSSPPLLETDVTYTWTFKGILWTIGRGLYEFWNSRWLSVVYWILVGLLVAWWWFRIWGWLICEASLFGLMLCMNWGSSAKGVRWEKRILFWGLCVEWISYIYWTTTRCNVCIALLVFDSLIFNHSRDFPINSLTP